jgi:hypothetical protein
MGEADRLHETGPGQQAGPSLPGAGEAPGSAIRWYSIQAATAAAMSSALPCWTYPAQHIAEVPGPIETAPVPIPDDCAD